MLMSKFQVPRSESIADSNASSNGNFNVDLEVSVAACVDVAVGIRSILVYEVYC